MSLIVVILTFSLTGSVQVAIAMGFLFGSVGAASTMAYFGTERVEKKLRKDRWKWPNQVLVNGFRVYYNLVRTHQTLRARPSDLALGVNIVTNNRWLELIKKAYATQRH